MTGQAWRLSYWGGSSLKAYAYAAVRQVLGFQVLHSFLFSAFLFSPAYDDSFRNSFSISNRFLSLGLFPIT